VSTLAVACSAGSKAQDGDVDLTQSYREVVTGRASLNSVRVLSERLLVRQETLTELCMRREGFDYTRREAEGTVPNSLATPADIEETGLGIVWGWRQLPSIKVDPNDEYLSSLAPAEQSEYLLVLLGGDGEMSAGGNSSLGCREESRRSALDELIGDGIADAEIGPAAELEIRNTFGRADDAWRSCALPLGYQQRSMSDVIEEQSASFDRLVAENRLDPQRDANNPAVIEAFDLEVTIGLELFECLTARQAIISADIDDVLSQVLDR
jgi:hypothetical protein